MGMKREMVFINEGFCLDDAENLITTTFIDYRLDGEKDSIPALVKGCKREHALESGETVLISKPARFREYGEELIQDSQEGLAKEESFTVKEETAAEAAKRRAVADMNEAHELTQSRVQILESVTYSSRDTESRSFSYGKEWWIYCASIEPNDEEWDSWRATLPQEYDHVSGIGQPSKFARALAQMVTEQIGPQGKDGWLKQTTKGFEAERTKYRTQWVIHGPVAYTDQVYEVIAGESEGMERIAAFIFTKHSKYAAQREYRFAVLNEGADDETVLLRISGMMRDSLVRMEGGMIRTLPNPVQKADRGESNSASKTSVTVTPTHSRTSITERQTKRRETRGETRTADGQVMSWEGECEENINERVVTREDQPDSRDSLATIGKDHFGKGASEEQPAPNLVLASEEYELIQSDEDAVKELALAEREWNYDRQPKGNFTIPMVHQGTGRVYKSFEEAFSDPAYPMNPQQETWRERKLNPSEIAKAYGFVDTLNWKLPRIEEEFRQDVASASWYAMECVRNIYAHVGDIIESLWIERNRFVVIHLKDSEILNATGRIVIAPSGTFAYCLQLPDKETSGYGGKELGTIFFPMGTVIENFEEFGWPIKCD